MNEEECRVDKSEMLSELKTVLETDESDFTLLSYLEQAKHIILGRLYPYISGDDYDRLEMPSKFESKQIRIAAYLMNKRGAEGEVQHIENGIHRNYGNADVPSAMLQDVLPYVGIPR